MALVKTILIIFLICGCNLFASAGPLVVYPSSPTFTKEGYDLIVNSETGGQGYYNKFLKFPTVPPGDSGITIGVGFDTQFYGKSIILNWWKDLGDKNVNRIANTAGFNHIKAKSTINSIKDILISWDLATTVFNNHTIPQYYSLALRTYPGLDKLCLNAQASITSVIFNRGSSLSGPARIEMRDLKDEIAKKDYAAMASSIRSMKRIWAGKDMDGLLIRRNNEAKLIESCISR